MNINRRALLASAAATAALGTLPRFARAAAVDGPPVARIEPVTETLYGVTVTDPYRWMENPNDPDWLPFMKGQGAYAESVLAKIPGRDALRKRIAELSNGVETLGSIEVGGPMYSAVAKGGPYTFVQKRPPGANADRLYVREGDGALRVLVDPATRTNGDVHFAISFWKASPDGKHIAYGLAPSGSEDAVIEIIETATGKILPERIERAHYTVISWSPDSRSFFVNLLAEGAKRGTADYFKNGVAWLHKVGTEAKNDIRVLARGMFDDLPLNELELPVVIAQSNSNYVLAVLKTGVQSELRIFVNTLDAASKGKGGWKGVATAEDKVTAVWLAGSDIYLLTYADAPRSRLMRVKADNPAYANAKEVVPQGKTVLQNIFAAKDGLYIQALDGGVNRLSKLGADGKSMEIALPFEGSVSAGYANVDREGMLALIQGLANPPQLIAISADGLVSDTGLIAKPAVNLSDLAQTRVFAKAKDGVMIPILIAHAKGIKRNGEATALVAAYGAFGTVLNVGFNPRFAALLEQGGMLAIAGVRGGGEYGREWYEAGKGPNKPNTWRDLIACCEKLIADGWTSKERLSIVSASAGGIPIGRCLTERPELFAAAVDEVPLCNMLRFEFSQNGAGNVPEFGSVKTEEGFKQLYEMDSYVHIKDGVKYPAVFLTTGIQDPRVDPWQPAKMAARLQKATASGKPVLLRVDFQAGHFDIGATREQADNEFGDMLSSVLWQTGVPAFQPKG